MSTTETITATLAARLYDFATGAADADSIPGEVFHVLTLGPVDHDAANVAMNTEADEIRDGHDMEYSVTIREDDRANLFTNVAGYMLRNDTAGMDDTAIVDAAIADSYDDGEPARCELAGCDEDAKLTGFTDGEPVYRHARGEHDHDPVITDDGQRAALIERVRSWSD